MAKVMKMLNFKSNKLHKDSRGFPSSQLPQGKDLLEDNKSRPQEAEETEKDSLELITSEEDSSNFAGDKRRVSISKSGRFTLKESQKRAALTILNHDDDDEGEDGKAKKVPSTNNENKKNTENDKENVEIRTKCKELKNQVNEERRESCCSVLDGNAVVAEIESLAIQEQSRQAALVTDL